MARTRIPGMTLEAERAVNQAFDALEARIRKLEGKPAAQSVRTADFVARPGELIIIEAPAAGITGILPTPNSTNRNARVTLSFRNANPVRLVCVDGTINTASSVTNTAPGTIECICDGETGWSVDTGLSSSGSATDAAYLVSVAHGSLPNARVATDSAEIDADITLANVISWALRTSSVAASKLQDLTGLSVFGRAANSTGVMAAITAGTQGHHLMRVTDTLAWGDPAGSGLTLATTGVLNVGGSTSITVNANDIQRPALTGAITAAANVNATLFGATASGAGLTGGGTAVLAVGAGTRITVGADTVSWTGFDLNVNGAIGSTAWIGIDIIDSSTVAWTTSVPGGAFLGLALNVVDGSIGPSKLTVKVPIPEGIVLAAGNLIELKCDGTQISRVCTSYIDVNLTTGAITYGADDASVSTSVTIVSTPSVGSVRVVQFISIHQVAEDLTQPCTVNFDDGAGTERILFGPMTLTDGCRVEFSVGNGWKVQSPLGAEL